RVREVDDAEAIPVPLELRTEPFGDLRGGHLGLLVVGADVARAWHEDSGLSAPLLFAAAVEEVRHVRVLLGLGDVQLPNTLLGESLRKRLVDLLLAERGRTVEVVAVARHRGHRDVSLPQPLRQLAGSIGPEIEEDDRIEDRIDSRLVLDDDRLDELVRHSIRIVRLNRCRSWSRTRPEPIVRWPTSELPIWPGGSPTALPDASSVVCGYSAQ